MDSRNSRLLSTNFKKRAKTPEELRRRRNEISVELRRNRRDETLLKRRMKKVSEYLMDESKCDVVFIVEKQRIPAFKLVLSLKSDVFDAMFSGDFKEAIHKEIIVEDLNAEAFKSMVHYLHFDELDLKEGFDYLKAFELLKCGHKYHLKRLMSCIEDYLIPYINIKSSKQLYETSVFYGLKKMRESLNRFIATNLDDFVCKRVSEVKEINTLSDNYLLEAVIEKHLNLKSEDQKLKTFITDSLYQEVVINGYTFKRGYSDVNQKDQVCFVVTNCGKQ